MASVPRAAVSRSLLLLALVAVLLPSSVIALGFQSNPAPSRRAASIPSWCHNPSGADCTWYTSCLEAKIPCRGGPADYAIAYADHYCKKYAQRASSFSAQGRRWIDGVRKCLQVDLAPELSRSPSPSCSAIKSKAIASHVSCYLDPPGAPSVCNLPVSDWAQIVWTVGAAFLREIITSAKVATSCLGRIIG